METGGAVNAVSEGPLSSILRRPTRRDLPCARNPNAIVAERRIGSSDGEQRAFNPRRCQFDSDPIHHV